MRCNRLETKVSTSEPLKLARMVEKTLVQQYVRIAVVVAAYWFISITLVFVNKSLLSGAAR